VIQLQDNMTGPRDLSNVSTPGPVSPSPKKRDRVFVSYSHLDNEWLNKLREFLNPDIRNGRIDYRDDRNLEPGDDWYKLLVEYIAHARVAVLLVSPHFLTSRFIMEKELPLILEAEGQGLTILWVPLSGTFYGSNAQAGADRVTCYQAVWDPNQPLDAFPEESRNHHLLDLCKQISKLVTTARRPNNLPFAPLGNLLKGREDDLARLDQQLRLHGSSAIVQPRAVSGPGGIGKTRLAVEYARCHQDDFTALLFVSAGSPTDLNANMARLSAEDGAIDLTEYRSAPQPEQYAAVIRWLQQNKGWLLILDNVDTKEAVAAVQKLVAKLTGGHVIVTSRITMWGSGIPRFPLGALSADAAVALLIDKANSLPRTPRPDDAQQARLLAEQLGYLPLALTHAAAYVGESDLAFDTYLKEFDQALQFHEGEVFEYDADPENAKILKTVATTYFLSIDRLGPVEKTLLRAASFLAPAPIPMAIFADCPDELKALVDLWCEETGEPTAGRPLRDAVTELVRYSLIERSGDLFTIHRMERLVLGHKVPKERIPRWIEATRAALIRYAPEETAENPKTWPVWDILRPHAEALVNQAKADKRVEPSLTLIVALGQLYYGKGLYAESLLIDEMALELANQSEGSESESFAYRQLSYGETLRVMGRYSDAEVAFRKCLAIREKLDGPGSLTVASGLNYLAIVLRAQGRLQESEALQRQALAIYEDHGDDADNGDVAKSLNNLACVLEDQGKKGWMDESEGLRKRAVLLAEESLGRDNPKALLCLANLASLLGKKGNTKEAVALFRRALEGFEPLGIEHQYFLDVLTRYANLLRAEGDMGAAEPLLRRAVEATEKTGRTERSQSARDLNTSALRLRLLKRFAEAAALLQRAIRIEDRSLPPNHLRSTRCRNNLAIIRMLNDQLDEARSVNAEAWSLKDGHHDVTSGRALFIRTALCWLGKVDASHYLGQLRTLLAQPEISCLGGTDHEWQAADILDELRSRLASEKSDLLAAIVAALDEPGKVADLERFDIWHSTSAVPLEAPWPDAPESGSPPGIC
jgi:tetratricopeptide (TPR) repeat protein